MSQRPTKQPSDEFLQGFACGWCLLLDMLRTKGMEELPQIRYVATRGEPEPSGYYVPIKEAKKLLATAAKQAREEALGPLVSRHGLYTTPDFPCPYCKNPAYLYHIGGGKSTHARVQFTHLAGGNDCVKARALAAQPSPQKKEDVK